MDPSFTIYKQCISTASCILMQKLKGNFGLLKTVWECIYIFSFLKDPEKAGSKIKSFPQTKLNPGGFTIKYFQKFNFNFLNSDRFTQVFQVLVQPWDVIGIQEHIHFCQVLSFCDKNIIKVLWLQFEFCSVFYDIPHFISVSSLLKFSLYFFVSLPNNVSILFNFFKEQMFALIVLLDDCLGNQFINFCIKSYQFLLNVSF